MIHALPSSSWRYLCVRPVVQVSGGETGAQFPVQASSAYLSAVTDASAAFDRATAAVNAEVVHIIGECTSLLATLKGCVAVLPRVFHNKLTHTILCTESWRATLASIHVSSPLADGLPRRCLFLHTGVVYNL
jgi:hypothetical protein